MVRQAARASLLVRGSCGRASLEGRAAVGYKNLGAKNDGNLIPGFY